MSRTAFNTKGLPWEAEQTLKSIGANFAVARKRRRLKMEDIAQRIHCTRQTIANIENGNPGVAMGVWINYAFVLNLLEGFLEICKPENDQQGMWLDKESRSNLQRIRDKYDKELDF